MKHIAFILLLCFVGNVSAQDFNIEYKAYLLQSYFKERQIKSVTIQNSEDSLFKNRSIQYTLEFDKHGRLVKVLDYYFDTDTIPERMITYSYGEGASYYKSKMYHYLDAESNVVLQKAWLLHFDF